jgi:hypothetical protein
MVRMKTYWKSLGATASRVTIRRNARPNDVLP